MLIQKDGTTLDVTRGAYMSLFEPQGWKPVKGTTNKRKSANATNFMAPQPNKSSAPEQDEINESEIPFGNMMNHESELEDDIDDEDYEVVLEEMTIKELVEYAEEHDIDLEGATKKADIIGIIEAVEEE